MATAASAAPIRVLLVDDSAVMRRLVAGALQEEPDIVVASSAPNGRAALELLAGGRFDAVVLDIEMPELDGLDTLRELRPRWPDLPVVMYSTLTRRGATATLDALSLGATDYVLKPSQLGDLEAARAAVRNELAPVLRTWTSFRRARALRRQEQTASLGAGATAPVGDGAEGSTGRPSRAASQQRGGAVRAGGAATRPGRVEAVVVGCSTGGPHALTELLPTLPASLPVPLMVVQHMPPLFTKLLAERLDAHAGLHVLEAVPGAPLEAGTVYVAPGGVHLVARRAGVEVVVGLDDGPPENSCKPSVDVLFRSAAAVWGGNVLAVILTGMGQDGLEGVRELSQAGATVLAQDEATSVVWGMPGAVARAGLATALLPLAEIGPAIARAAGRHRNEVPA